MSDKKVNYTDEMVAQLHDGYDADASEDERRAQVDALAVALDRSVPSVRAKLTREGLYVPYAKAAVKAKVARKADLVQALAVALGVSEEVIESLEKATKPTLVRLLEFASK